MKSTEELISEASAMNAYLQQEQQNDLGSLLESLVKLEVYLARANEMLAQAKARKEEATMARIEDKGMLENLPASLANKYLSASVRLENYAVDLLDGICSTIRNSMDSKRTRISALKEEIRQLRSPDMFRPEH